MEKINIQTKLEDPWKILQEAISNTLQDKETNDIISMIMEACQDLVNIGKLDEIYDNLHNQLKEHFEGWHKQLQNISGNSLLTLLNDQYDDFKRYCEIFPVFYTSYDQYFSNDPNKILKSIRQLFNEIILSDVELFKNSTTPSILNTISIAQQGSEINLDKIKNIIQMYYSFNDSGENTEIFQDFYDKLVIKESSLHDSFFSSNFKTSSFTTYLKNLQLQYQKESTIMKSLLSAEHSKEILKLFNIELLQNKQNCFLHDAKKPRIVEALLSDDLHPMKYLVDTYNESEFDLNPIYEACACYINDQMLKVKQEINRQNDEDHPIDSETEIIMIVHRIINTVITLSKPYKEFFTSKEAQDELDKQIIKAWNDDSLVIVRDFNVFIEHLITSNFKDFNKDEMIEIIPRFYGYIIDREMFDFHYEELFNVRIIQNRSTIDENEYLIIAAIRKVSPKFMINYENIQKYICNSEIMKEEFMKSLDEICRIDIEPFVFESNNFPLAQTNCNLLPLNIAEWNNKFIDFYASKHKNQMDISLNYEGSSVELRIQFPQTKRTYTFTVDLICASVIIALSNPKKFLELVEITGEDNARKVCTKLLQMGLINRSTENTTFDDADEVFSINPHFRCTKTKIIIKPINII